MVSFKLKLLLKQPRFTWLLAEFGRVLVVAGFIAFFGVVMIHVSTGLGGFGVFITFGVVVG